jgi:short chain dehydrogenase
MTMRDTTELFDLTGKVVIVTGSTKGIGRAMVEGLARAGASVVVSSRKQELCDEVAKEVASATGADVLGLACHAGEWDEIPGFVDGVLQRFGRVDGLVNNAGINPARVTPARRFFVRSCTGRYKRCARRPRGTECAVPGRELPCRDALPPAATFRPGLRRCRLRPGVSGLCRAMQVRFVRFSCMGMRPVG